MVKIIFDIDNKYELQLVDNYYYAKYYIESILFDWKQESYTDGYLRYVYKHLNKFEFRRLRKVLHPVLPNYIAIEDLDALIWILCDGKKLIKQLKRGLIYRFGSNKNKVNNLYKNI